MKKKKFLRLFFFELRDGICHGVDGFGDIRQPGWIFHVGGFKFFPQGDQREIGPGLRRLTFQAAGHQPGKPAT